MIVIRKDLNMRRGKEIAQGAHASLKATLENLDDPRVKKWLGEAFTKIAVSVDSEQQLIDLFEEAKRLGLICAEIIDNGDTEFSGVKTRTCIAIGPDEPAIINSVTGKLKLL